MKPITRISAALSCVVLIAFESNALTARCGIYFNVPACRGSWNHNDELIFNFMFMATEITSGSQTATFDDAYSINDIPDNRVTQFLVGGTPGNIYFTDTKTVLLPTPPIYTSDWTEVDFAVVTHP